MLHSNIVATIACVEPIFKIDPDTSYLSYLPLAHIFEVSKGHHHHHASLRGGDGKRATDMCSHRVPLLFPFFSLLVAQTIAEMAVLISGGRIGFFQDNMSVTY